MNKLFYRMVSAVLALSMVSSIASSSWADTGSGEDQYGSDFKLLLNTSEADNTGSWSLNYGQDISFDVSGTGITSGAVKSYYYVASGEDKLAAFTTDTTLKCGTYNLSYTVDDTTGSTNEYYDSTGNQTYTLTVKQATLMTPSDAVWTNGSAASWSAVTKTTDSADIDAGTELSYSVKLYKDGVEADTETTTSTTFDFTDKIITLGKGAYTFTVSATPTTNTDLYLGSGSSAASASTTAVDVSFVKGNGVTSIDNTSNALMITGNSTYNIASRTAAIATGFTSAAWSVSSAYLTVTPSGTGNTGVSVSFNGNAITSTTATVNVVGNETDVPTITNLSCNSNNVTATLSDSGSGVAAYAFSQSDSSDGVTWETPETVVGSTDKTFSLTATGTWYVWVKDVCGNVTRSDAINVGSVTYHNYYDQGTSSLADKVVYYSFTGASKTLTSLETTARPGFTSSGWFTDSALTGTAATSVTLTTAAPSCEVWHKWTLTDATWTTVPVGVTKTYDGKNSAITAVASTSEGVSSTITYQWYRKLTGAGSYDAVAGATASSINVKDVADSGSYYVVATITIDGVSAQNTSSAVDVAISPIALTVKPANKKITYLAAVPSSYSLEVVSGAFASGETVSVLGSVDYATNYTAGSNIGSYDITATIVSNTNYSLTVNKGVLTVNAKSCNDSTVSVTLAQTTFSYDGTAKKPAYTVTDSQISGSDKSVPASNYSVSYSNNINSGTASVIFTFTGNYTGTVTKTFTISKGSFTPSVTIANAGSLKYGATDSYQPSLVSSPSGIGAVTYYYASATDNGDGTYTAGTYSKTKPVNAGTYAVYATVAAGEYEASTSAPFYYTIAKRNITITTGTGSWVYDGNTHRQSGYSISGDGFATSEGFKSVEVTGSIIYVGTVSNSVTATFTGATNANNYAIVYNLGQLTVTKATLTAPTTYVWNTSSSTAPATAEWVPVTKENVTVGYNIQLYKVDNSSGTAVYNAVGDAITTTAVKYDFTSIIRANGKGQYVYTIQTVPYGGDRKDCFNSSAAGNPYSSNSGSIYAVSIAVTAGSGVDSVSAEGGFLSAGSHLLITGESLAINAVAQTGYGFSSELGVWSASNTTSGITINNVGSSSTAVTAGKKGISTYEVELVAKAYDEAPVISNYHMSDRAADGSTVTLSADLSDTKGLTAWAISTSATLAGVSDSEWHSVEGEAATAVASRVITVSDVTAQASYYVYVKDNQSPTPNSAVSDVLSVYRISFDKGDTTGEVVMNPVLKVQNEDITLPLNAFTKDQYAFSNWKLSGVNTYYPNGGVFAANGTSTLVAQWTNEKFNYKLNYYYMNLDGTYNTTPDKSVSSIALYGTVINTDDSSIQKNMTGFVLDSSVGHSGSITLMQNNLELNIYYKRVLYTINYSYVKNGATVQYGTSDYYYGQTITELEKPVADGYTFSGWNYSTAVKPTTMPANNLDVTGEFEANTTVYYVNRYLQNVDCGNSYTLLNSTSCNGVQDENVYAGKDGASVPSEYADYTLIRGNDVTGFTYQGVAVTYGSPAGSTLTQQVAASATATISAVSSNAVYINFYYTRNTYTITLNVWKGDPAGAGSVIYTKPWTVAYGTQLDSSVYETYEQDKWDDSTDLTDYVLADYVNWSTGTKPTSMPAGDVTITREYVNSNEIKDYSIEVYFADVDGNYSASDMQSFTYRAALGSEITFGTGSNYTVNTQTFDMLLADKIYAKYNGEVLWTYDSSNPNTVSSIALTESGNNTIKVYYKRASVTSNVRYVYIDKNGASHTIATQQLSGTWGSTYTVDVDRFFYADSDTTGFNGTADSTYAAKNYNTSDCMCQVQYSTLTNGLLLGTTNLGAGYRSSKITKDSELTSDFTATYRGDIGNYIYVYYCEVNANDYDFYLDVKYSLANLDSASRSNGYITSKYGASTFNYEIPTAGMTSYSGTATTLPVRVANKAFFYSDTAVSVSGTQETGYLAAGYTPSYTCSTLKAGYTRITDYTDSGYEFYVGPDASGNGEYFYIAATDNRFYLGNITSYTLTSTTPKYSELTGALLTDYKANATSDTERDGVYLYNHSWGSGIVGNSNGTCIINYAYAKTYKINFCFNSQIYTTAGYRENTNADLNTAIAGCTAFDSQIPEGYEIKWYYDDALTRPVSSGDTLKMDGYKSLYGQLIRSTVFYNQCSFYESPDTVSYNGVNYDYFTSEMLADTNLVASSTVNKTVSITNGLGVSESINTTVTTYTYNGFVVAVIEKVPTLSNSTIVWNVSAITPPDGYEYDSSNSNNRNQAYIRAASTDLKAYYCCKEYELTVNQNNGTNTWLEEHNGKSTVTLDNPVYEGYVFDGWTPSDNTVNITLNSGVSTFAMPIGDMTVTAKWKPASLASPIVANHYFQRTDGSYDKTLLTSIGKAATKETVTVGSVVYTVYKDAGGAVIGASTMTGTETDNSYTIRYFDAFDAATGSSEADLCCAVTYINRQTDGTTIYTESTVDSTGYILDEGNTYSFNHACYSLNGANTVITSDSATKTFIYMPGMTIDYYYDMPFDNEIRTAAFAADGSSDTGISTLTGSDSYYYGRTVTIAATLNPGYDIVGWYNAADVLDNYDINSSASLSSYSLKANITATPVSTALSFSAVADATRKDYVLITSIKAVGDATVSVSGKQTYDYNYSSADTSRFLSTTVNFAQGVDTTVNYVSGYQWYTKDAGGNLTAITGANSAAYNFPSGKNAGTYTYVCEATITRTDNGKTRKVMSDDFKITVNPISVPVSATSYSWIYDSTSKSPAVSYNLDSTTSASMTTYYSARELTAAEIATLEGGSGISGVTQTAPFSFSDVAVEVQIDGTTRVVPHTVYYYIVTTNSNYKTASGKVTATVSPKTITLTPRYDNSYSREYDGTVVISGTLSDTTSDKYKLSKGSNFYTINGICSKDVDATVLDFDAAYNDKDVSDANQITLTNIKVMILDNGNTVRDYNYIFNGSDSFVMSGYISQRSLPVAWSAGVGGTYSSGSYVYTYDGEKHAPLAALDDSISTAGTVEIAEGVKVSVSGEQKNVGNYNAYAALSSDSSEFSSSNYVIQNDVQAFAIKKNAGTVSQVDLSVAGISGEAVYDGKTHTVNSSYFGLGDLLPSGYTWTIDVTYEDAAGNVVEAPKAAGTYSVIPGNLKIYDNEGINVTDNYDMTYSNGSYVIKPCELTIDLSSLVRAADNIVADDKEYDTTTSATINSSVIKLANVVDGETVGITGVTGTFENKNAGSDKTVNLDTSSAVLTGADSSNYVFVQSTGLTTTASISKANITVTTSDGSWVYDGTAHTMHTTASITGLKGEDTLVDSDIVFTGTITEVGTVKNTISGITVRNSGDIVSDNYTYNAVEGTLEVTKASSLSITSGTKTWVYDDTVHTDKTYSIDFGSQTYTATDNGNGTFSYVLSTGDTVTITPSGIGASGVRNVSDTAASNNKFTYTVTNSSNYSSISTVYGKLSVTPAAITVKSSDTPTVSKVYDGTTAGTSFVGTDDYVFEGLQGDDTLQLSAFTATYDSADASQYDLNNIWTAGASKVTMTGLAINDGNYTLVTTTFDITAKITVATLVINVVNKSVTYGGSYSFDETSGLTYGTSGANGLVASDVGKTLAQIGITYNVTCDYDPLSTDNTKYGVGAYDITFNTTANNSNYNVITVNNGKLTVNQKVLSVTADDKTFTYGDIETYTSKISGFVRSETEAGVISGAVTYSSTCSSTTVAGTYSKAITPVTTGLTISSMGKDGTTPNYKFSVANGTVTINRKAITLTGVTASDRTYNAAKTAVLAAANPSCAQLDFGTATYSNGVLTIPVTGLNLNGTDDVNNLSYKITVTGVYASGDAGENIAVTLTGTLDTELAKRYTLNALGSANANINKAVLTVTCVNKSVVYGSAAPSYTVSYSGFVGTQTTAVLTTVPKATCNEYSGTSPFTSVGTYTGVITAAGGVDENYSFSYVPGNVTVTQAQLATPAPVWSSTAPGSISWAAIAGKGDATVTGYTATLYDQNNAVVDTQTVTGTSYDFASAIRAHGAGAYTVGVVANSSNQTNCKNSAQGKSGSVYAAKITLSKASDTYSTNGITAMTVNSASTYVMIAGESGIAVDATLANATGYSVKSWMTSSKTTTDSTVSAVVSPSSTTSPAGSFSGNVAVSSKLNSYADINLVLTLTPTSPTLSLAYSVDNPVAMDYNYPDTRTITVTPSVVSGDNVTTGGYTYSYVWHYYKGASDITITDGTTSNIGDKQGKVTANGNQLVFETGNLVGTYIYYCVVTATRTDNSASKTVDDNSKKVTLTVNRGKFLPVITISGWTWGDERKAPSYPASFTPPVELQTTNSSGVRLLEANTTYMYSTDNSNETAADDTTTVPTNAGTYYVYADVAATSWYDRQKSAPVEFTIAKTQLSTPTGLAWTTSGYTTIGDLSWNAVASTTEPNNGSLTENNGSGTDKISVSYTVRLYKKDGTAGSPDTLINTYTTTATKYDASADINKNGQGTYYFTVVANSSNTGNCDDSALETSPEITVDIVLSAVNLADSLSSTSTSVSKVYDGYPYRLNVSSETLNLTGATYAWYKNGQLISGATGSSFDVANVSDTGSYHCVISVGGTTYRTNFMSVTVTARPINVEASSQTRVYNAQPLTNAGFTVTGTAMGTSVSGVAGNQSTILNVTYKGLDGSNKTVTEAIANVSVTGSQTYAGSSDNTASGAAIMNGSTDVSGNYAISYSKGTLKVTKAALTITANSTSWVFDNTEHTDAGFSKTAPVGLQGSDKVNSITASGAITDVGTCDNVPSGAVVKSGTTDVTANYEISYVKGTLTVTQSGALTANVTSYSETYDSESHSIAVAATGAAGSAATTISYSTDKTNWITTAPEYKNVTGGAVTVYVKVENKNYVTVETSGTVTITKAPLTITANSHSWTYTSSVHKDSGYSVSTTDKLQGSDTVSAITVTGEITNAGTADNTITPSSVVIKDGSEDVTGNYSITCNKGTLEVTKAPLAITANSNSWVYTSSVHKDSGYSVSTTNKLQGTDAISAITVTGEITNVGTVDNTITPASVKIVNGSNENVTGNYSITCNNGTLEVTKAPLTITANSNSWVYTSSVHKDSGYSVSTTNKLQGTDAISAITVTGEITNVGTVDNTITPASVKIVNGSNENVTGNYSITCNNGTLKVTKAPLTITANTNSWTFDATSHTDSGYSVSVTNKLQGTDAISAITVTGEITDVGTCDNVPSSAVVKNGETDVTANYEISYVKGTLTVTQSNALKANVTSYSGTYDSESHSIAVAATGAAGSAATTISYSTDKTNWITTAPEYKNVTGGAVTVYVKVENKNYVTVETSGTVTITKAPLTITANSNSWVYTSSVHKDSGYSVSTTNKLQGTDAISAITVTGEITDVGTCDNVPSSAVVKNGTTDVTANYEISYVKGTLTVTQSGALTANVTSYSGVYDSESHTIAVAATGAAGSAATTVSYSTDKTNWSTTAPEYKNITGGAVTVYVKVENKNYVTVQTSGTVTITKAPLTIEADSQTWTYDNTKHTDSGYSVSATNKLQGTDAISAITVTGEITDVGTCDNVPSSAVVKNGTTDVTANYEISYVKGTLTVTQSGALTATVTSYSGTYDSESHSIAVAATGAAGSAATTVSYSMDKTNWSTTAPEYKNVTGGAVTVYVKVTNPNYVTVETSGTVTITKAPLTITANSHSWTYTSSVHKDSGYSVSATDKLQGSDTVSAITVTGEITNVGTVANTITPASVKIVNGSNENVTGNYSITCNNGTLKVTKAPLTITANTNSWTFDATSHTDSGYSVSTTDKLQGSDTVSAITVTGEITDVGTCDNVPSGAVVKNGETDVTANYEISYVNGTLTVTQSNALKANVTSYSGTYDSESHSIAVAATGAAGSAATTISYSTDKTNWSTTAPEYKNITGGAVTVYVKVENKNYVTVQTSGTVTITKAPLTIEADSQTWTYDNTKHTDSGYSVSATNKLQGTDAISAITVTGEITNVGTADNVIDSASVVIKDGSEDVTSNYNLQCINGTLKVVSSNGLIVTVTGYSGIYDGQPHSVSFQVNHTSGTTISYSTDNVNWTDVMPQFTDAADAAVTVYVKAENPNYDSDTSKGTVVIEKKELTVTTGSDTMTYDGSALKDADASISGFVSGEDATIVATGSQVNAGTSDNTYTITWTSAKESNYSVTESLGTLEVTKADAEVSFDYTSGGIKFGENIVFDATTTNTDSTAKLTVQTGDASVATASASADGKVTITPTGLGKATITVVSPETENYKAASKTYEVTVTIGTINATANNNTFTFNGKERENDIPVSSVAGVTVFYSTDNSTWSTTMPQYENAGTYTTYYKLEAANYTPFFGSFTTTINPKAVTDPTVTFGSVEDQKWTGEKITPKLVVTDSATGNILAEGIDYTLAYVNNIDEGTATVTITGISNYEYSRTMTFGISRTRYELTFNPDGGNWNGSTEPVKLVYVENAVITIYQAPTREGYTFVEWHGSSYQPGDSYTVTGAHTFTAVWRKNETAQAVVATGEDGRYLLRSMFFIACSAAIVLTMCIRKKKENHKNKES